MNSIAKEASISVAVRIRPLTPDESTLRKIVDVVDDRMLVFDPHSSSSENPRIGRHNKRHKEHKFIFDRLFDEDSSQSDIYENSTKPSIDAALQGYNSTIFAYGATGCGKTFTISGTPESPGIIFLALKDIFDYVSQNSTEREISIQISYLEIYNENIIDLLNIETNTKKLTLLENENSEIIVNNLSKYNVSNVEDVMDLIIRGNYNRTVSPTEANLTSSRSHAVLQVYISQSPILNDVMENSAKSVLSIIDLAGSERASATKNTGLRLHEGANINKSLLALGNCINALCDNRKNHHIPYRNSKLTRLLKFSLGGNCKTVMIVCISPSYRHYDETLNALKFANRAKEIKTKVVRNKTTVMKHVGSYMKIISDQKRKIYELETLMDVSVKREMNTFNEQRKNIYSQIDIMIERIEKNLNNYQNVQSDQIFNIAKRKLLLVYLKQFTDFSDTLVELEDYNQLSILKEYSLKFINHLRNSLLSLNQNTKLNDLLVEYSESFHKRLREMDGWSESDDVLYLKQLDLLKTRMEFHIGEESSILFDSWFNDNNISIDMGIIPKTFAQYLVIFSSLDNLDTARVKCEALINGLINNIIQQMEAIDLTNTNGGNMKILNNSKKRTHNTKRTENDDEEQNSFIRQGNRINSINNKLMRVNLESSKEDESLSEIESSLILDSNKGVLTISKNMSANNYSTPSLFLNSESTPQKNDVFNGDFDISPNISKISKEYPNRHDISTIQEWEESNSSIVIRKDENNNNGTTNENNKIKNSDNNVNRNIELPEKMSPSTSFSPTSLHFRRSRFRRLSNDQKLTSKKLIASPKITSPHRLVGFDSKSNNLQFQDPIQDNDNENEGQKADDFADVMERDDVDIEL